jgi:CRP-like cAMP-binding protein
MSFDRSLTDVQVGGDLFVGLAFNHEIHHLALAWRQRGNTSRGLSRNIQAEEDLVDHLFNSSEKRLARILLLLANFGKNGKMETIPKISQEILAARVGTTRSRINFFMNKFRKLGFIEYSNGPLKIHASLMNVIVHQ